jgi:hypothetical protein
VRAKADHPWSKCPGAGLASSRSRLTQPDLGGSVIGSPERKGKPMNALNRTDDLRNTVREFGENARMEVRRFRGTARLRARALLGRSAERRARQATTAIAAASVNLSRPGSLRFSAALAAFESSRCYRSARTVS